MTLFHRSLLLGCLLLGLSLPLGGCGSALSREKEIQIGEQAAPQFLNEGGGEIPDPKVQQYVEGIGRKLLNEIPAEDRRELPWEFHTLNSAVLNAFALPGGKVFVTRGLMERMDNEAQLAGVIGHEIGHVIAEHIGKQMSRQQGLQIGLGVIGAVADSQWVGVLGGAGGNLYLLRFGRGQELEADRLGMSYMAKAGYDPSQMMGVMKVLKEGGAGGGAEMLSTHPNPETRIEQAKDLMRTEYAHTRDNPKYELYRDRYEAMLAQLRKLPPPKPAKQAKQR